MERILCRKWIFMLCLAIGKCAWHRAMCTGRATHGPTCYHGPACETLGLRKRMTNQYHLDFTQMLGEDLW